MATATLPHTLQETLAAVDTAGAPGEPLTTDEVAAHLDLAPAQTATRLQRLVEEGLLATKQPATNVQLWWRNGTDAPAALCGLDAEGHIHAWSPGAESLTGYPTTEIEGEPLAACFAGDPPPLPDEGATTTTTGHLARADGTTVPVRTTLTRRADHVVGLIEKTRPTTASLEHRLAEGLLESHPEPLLAIDTAGNLRRWNDRLREITGLTDAELARRDLQALVAADARDDLDTALTQVHDTGEVVTIELPIDTAEDTRPYECTASPLRDPSDAIVGSTILARDVSDRKARERQLARQRDDLRAELDEIFTRIDEAFLALDTDWRITYVNDRAAALVRLPVGELIGANVWDVLHEVAEGYPRAMAERAMRTQEAVDFEFRSVLLDRWVEIRAYPSETGLSVYVRDITARKERERELQRYETLAHTASDVMVTIDADSVIRDITPAVTDVFGYEPAEVRGEPLTTLMPERLRETHLAAMDRYLATGERHLDWDYVELPGRHADGSELPLSLSFSEYEQAGTRYFTGIIRDITERKERERALEARVRQQEVVADLGRRALEADDLDALLQTAADRLAATLDTDDSAVFELRDDQLHRRAGVGWKTHELDATVPVTDEDTQATRTLASEDPLVIEDVTADPGATGPELGTPDGRSGISAVIGSVDDPWGVLATHAAAPRAFSPHDATFVQAVANILATAITRHDREEALRTGRARLAALNTLNGVARDITDAVIEQSTRDEIETIACERLAATESYEFAWLCRVDPRTGEIIAQVEAGVDGYLEDISLSIDSDDPTGQGPTGRAARTKELQVVRDAFDDPDFEPWREAADRYGFRASAAIPIVHDGALYGILNVYTDRADAFAAEERDVIAQLGKTIGHAINAIERKRALMSDEAIELEFHVPDIFAHFGTEPAGPGTITIDQVVPAGEERYLVYGTVTGEGGATLRALTEDLPSWEAVTLFESPEDATERDFELQLAEPPVISAIAARGGAIQAATIEDERYTLTVHLPPSVDSHQIIDAIQDTYPSAEMLARRQVTRADDPDRRLDVVVSEDLTDRQRATLQAAYHAGFFEWPRDATGEDIADALDISPPTFHQHLRNAERKVFGTIF